eukprot:gnl/TRDRNA2_/TRDRNA2_189938_c0_seq1.p1 gnl/TRDRNA2_/TRDRNA2_189938_c0~~gnl/TRDRNA2_/TRDRNA2_189938_c0_seq1.p1  ORF type:complete len:137 (+),score=23.98 gnl/TRDRNA2_/TRDRNA2_189938_c0_seq1:103-513(+)
MFDFDLDDLEAKELEKYVNSRTTSSKSSRAPKGFSSAASSKIMNERIQAGEFAAPDELEGASQLQLDHDPALYRHVGSDTAAGSESFTGAPPLPFRIKQTILVPRAVYQETMFASFQDFQKHEWQAEKMPTQGRTW